MSQLYPHNIEVEQALLGAVMVFDGAIYQVLEDNLMPESFYNARHQIIFRSMRELYQRQSPTDFTSLYAYLDSKQALESVGGLDYLTTLSKNASTRNNLKHITALVLEKAQLRHLIDSSKDIIDLASSAKPLDEILDEAETSLLKVTRDRNTSEFRTVFDVTNRVVEITKELSTRSGHVTGLKTNFATFDETTHGLQRGDLLILAARPAMGKTAFALNVALNTAISNPDISVALFSLEMPAEHLVNRMISTRGQIPGDHVRTGKLNKIEWNAFNHAADTIKQQRIFIDDSGYIKTTDIFSKCRKLATDENLGLIVIDYIQLISSNNERENRQEQVSKISRELKGLARELNVPVLALSQLSRQVESRQDKRPILSDLRESGSLEQDADIVMMLYRDSYYNRSDTDEPTPELELVELDIAKHRNGRTGTLNFQFQSSTGAFTSIASERR